MKKSFLVLTLSVLLVSFLVSIALAQPKEKEPVDSITLIHYVDGKVRPVGGGKVNDNVCSKLLGVKWGSLPVSYVINPNGYEPGFVTGAISAATAKWDSNTSVELFHGYPTNNNVAWGVYDGNNAYVFGPYSSNKVIAVTTYWYTRYSKQLVEYDVLFNTYYNWLDCTKTTCDSNNKGMDLQTIALHETGHGIGLADVYNKACSSVVMYGYGSYGEVKRSLADPDIKGLQTLYGA